MKPHLTIKHCNSSNNDFCIKIKYEDKFIISSRTWIPNADLVTDKPRDIIFKIANSKTDFFTG